MRPVAPSLAATVSHRLRLKKRHDHFFMGEGSYDGNPATVERFLSTIDCPVFRYTDVLECYSEIIGREWRRAAARLPESSSDDIELPEDGVGNLSRQMTELVEVQAARAPRGRPVSGDGRRVPIPWSDEETRALVDGLRAFGAGNWTQIRMAHYRVFDVNMRNARDLKDKHVTLMKSRAARVRLDL